MYKWVSIFLQIPIACIKKRRFQLRVPIFFYNMAKQILSHLIMSKIIEGCYLWIEPCEAELKGKKLGFMIELVDV